MLEKLGIDPRHYRALTRLAWRTDMRASRMGFGLRQKGRRPLLTFVLTILFYLLLGGIFAQFSYVTNDTFLGATFTLGGIMFMLGGLMMVEYTTIVISPDDYDILGYQPVSSRTYFFAKMTNVMIYIIAFTTVLGGPSVMMHAFRGEFSAMRLVLSIAAVYGAGLFVSLGAVVLYGTLLRKLTPSKMRSAITWLQFAISIVVYAGYLVLPDLLERHAAGLNIEKTAWFLLIPTTWFAALIELGYGSTQLFDYAGATIALCALVVFLHFAFSRMSLDYAHRISQLSAHSGDSPKREAKSDTGPVRGIAWSRLLRGRENRVVARLIYNQFKFDNKFKIAVLGVLPLLALYFFLGLRRGELPDPFLYGGESVSHFFVFFFALLVVPMIMKQNLEASDAFQASWIFYAAPADLAGLMIATRNALFSLFALPCLFFVFLVFGFYFENWLHALLHTITIAALTFLFLQILYLFRPGLPFAEPKTRGRRSLSFSLLFFVLPAFGLLVLHLVATFFYDSWPRLMLIYAVFLFLTLIFEQVIRVRIRRLTQRLQFEG